MSEDALTSPVTATIRARSPQLRNSELTVARFILENPREVVGLTVNELAAAVGLSRATVIRAAKRFGFSGYQQLRIGLAQEVGRSPLGPGEHTGPYGDLLSTIGRSVEDLRSAGSLLDAATVDRATELIAHAGNVFVVGCGLSGPVADDLAMRLSALGIAVSRTVDPLAQQIAAFSLPPGSVCVAVSGSGRNSATLAVVRAVREREVPVVLITTSEESPTSRSADLVLLVALPGMSDPTGITEITRLPLYLLGQALAGAVGHLVPDRGVAEKVAATVNAFAVQP